MYSSKQQACLWGLLGLAYSAATQLGPPGTFLLPISWPVVSVCIWLAYATLKNGEQDKRAVTWGILSALALSSFLGQDSDFSSWGDVYFFCGSRMQYCTCNFRWNVFGWYKAFVLWSFVLSTALGVQRLIIQLGLCGLLPGEEVVTRESFISICWRLIPYWLNNWEQQWGAECSSMMFELPHFAIELVIILPCVQILCSRMKVLAMPSVNAALPPGRDGRPEVVREEYVPNVLRGCWERQPQQRHIWHRIRYNKRIIAFSCTLCLLSLFNALYIPLQLEDLILQHPDAAIMQAVGRMPEWHDANSLAQLQQGLQNGSMQLGSSFVAEKIAAARQRTDALLHVGRSNTTGSISAAGATHASAAAAAEKGPWQNAGWVATAISGLVERANVYSSGGKQCPDVDRLRRNLLKHHEEIFRMQEPEHRSTIPLVEIALALMRLSTEKFFVLMSLYVAFLLFRVPPRFAAWLISLNARVSSAFARLILYSFPAVCWVYGAGFIFSTFVSVVFWGGPIMQLYEFLRTSVCSVSIKALRPATAHEIERMHGDCAICWCEMTVAPASCSSNRSSGVGSSSTQAALGRQDLQAAVAQAARAVTAGAETASQGEFEDGAVPLTEAQDTGATAAAPGSAVAAQLPEALSAASAMLHGYSLPCGHCYHQQCLNQWLQQCHSQNATPKCPMCQAPMELNMQWHLLWSWRRPGAAVGVAGLPVAGAAAGVGAAGAGDAANNYMLEHLPRLADLLADMPQILAQENVQLLAEVQDLRHQRQQLMGELQLRQQQLQELAGRQQQMELEGMEMEQQRRQLLQELQLLRRARNRQRELQQFMARQEQHSTRDAVGLLHQHAADMNSDTGHEWQHALHNFDAAGHAAHVQDDRQFVDLAGGLAEGMNPNNLERFRQLEMMLDAFISEQMQAASRAAAGAPPPTAAPRKGASTWRDALKKRKRQRQQQQEEAPAAAAGPGQGALHAGSELVNAAGTGDNEGPSSSNAAGSSCSRLGHARSASLDL